jgi:hypothetical protein
MEQVPLFAVNDQLLQVIEEAPRLTIQEEKKIIADTQKLSIRYMRHLCHNAARQSMKHIVHGTQYVVCWLLNHIHEKQQKNHTLFREKIATQLASFLAFLQQQSSSWFNLDAHMPHSIWQPMHEKIQVKIEPGKAFLLNDIEQDLVAVFQNIYTDTTTHPTPSFKQAHYWQALIQALCLEQEHPQYDTARCMLLLIRYNCNHPAFIRYVFSRYLLALDTSRNPHEHWQEALLHINRIIPEKETVLLVKEPDCKSALMQLIQTEMDAIHFSDKAKNIMQVSCPFQYTLSFTQLAVWLRMQTETGMIEHNNTTELIRYFAENALTNRNQNIAFKSLYNKYHQPERAAVQVMLEYNVRMQKILKALLQ